jgi:hypothetical protein
MEAEKITIVEGPPPTFELVVQPWLLSQAESAHLPYIMQCVLRTFNGQVLVERCRNAWQRRQPIFLEYRQSDGLRANALIVAAQAGEVAEGQVLQLWLKLDQLPAEYTHDVSDLGDDIDLGIEIDDLPDDDDPTDDDAI